MIVLVFGLFAAVVAIQLLHFRVLAGRFLAIINHICSCAGAQGHLGLECEFVSERCHLLHGIKYTFFILTPNKIEVL